MLHLEDTPPKSAPQDFASPERWIHRFRPDAILTDVESLGAMLASLQIDVPGDIGVAMLSTADDARAGVDQNSFEFGKMAVEILISQIHRNERGIPPTSHTHLVTPTWRDGETLPYKKGTQSGAVPGTGETEGAFHLPES